MPETPDLAALEQLRADLEAAAGPDTELDCRLHVALYEWPTRKVAPDIDDENAGWVYVPPGGIPDGFSYPPRGAISPYFHVPRDRPYTGELAAAMHLAEWCAPAGSRIQVPLYGPAIRRGQAWVIVERPDWDEPLTIEETGPNTAIALCKAVIAAVLQLRRLDPAKEATNARDP